MALILRKWGFFGVAAAALVVGCAGSGGSGTGGTTTGTTTGTGVNTAVVNQSALSSYGLVQFGYLTGQGRSLSSRAGSGFNGIVRRIELNDSVGTVNNPLDSELTLPLAGFQFQTKNLNAAFTTQNARLFESFPLDFLRFENNGSALTTPSNFPINIPARITAMPGRNTLVPIYVDDAIFTIDSTTGNVAFNSSLFNSVNLTNGTPVQSYFSDYVSFDITGLAATDLPVLADGTSAGRIYFSGDNYAISAAGTSGNFEALTLDAFNPILGSFGPPGAGGNPSGAAGHAGTFTLLQTSPVDPTFTMKVVALQGTWRDYTSLFNNISNFEVITFPSSKDNNIQEMVVLKKTGTTITQMYFGFADFDAATFRIYPISNIVSATTTGEVTGKITGLVSASGSSTTSFQAARAGTWQFDTAPSGFPTSGRFVVFRK